MNLGSFYTQCSNYSLMRCKSLWLLYTVSQSVSGVQMSLHLILSRMESWGQTGNWHWPNYNEQKAGNTKFTLDIFGLRSSCGRHVLFIKNLTNDILHWWNNNNVMLKLQSSVARLTWGGWEGDINFLEKSKSKYLYLKVIFFKWISLILSYIYLLWLNYFSTWTFYIGLNNIVYRTN